MCSCILIGCEILGDRRARGLNLDHRGGVSDGQARPNRTGEYLMGVFCAILCLVISVVQPCVLVGWWHRKAPGLPFERAKRTALADAGAARGVSLRWDHFPNPSTGVSRVSCRFLVGSATQLQLERWRIRRAAAQAATARANPHLSIPRPLKWHPRPVPS